MVKRPPFLSIVIPAYNEEKHIDKKSRLKPIKETLESLKKLTTIKINNWRGKYDESFKIKN